MIQNLKLDDIEMLMPGDKIRVRVTDTKLTQESIMPGIEVPYPWSAMEYRTCKVIDVFPHVIRCEVCPRPSFFGMSRPYNVTFDKRAIQMGDVIVTRHERR